MTFPTERDFRPNSFFISRNFIQFGGDMEIQTKSRHNMQLFEKLFNEKTVYLLL